MLAMDVVEVVRDSDGGGEVGDGDGDYGGGGGGGAFKAIVVC